MAKRQRSVNNGVIARRLAEGRGKGTGLTYKPWVMIQDAPSTHRRHRTLGNSGREHHLLNDDEQTYFAYLAGSPYVQDIREQYPLLPLELTQSIAKKYGLDHPTDPQSNDPVVLTTTFLVTLTDGSEQARTVVRATDLASPKTLARLEIERCYWDCQATDWGVVTDKDISTPVAQNLDMLRRYRTLQDRYPDLTDSDIYDAGQILIPNLTNASQPLRRLALSCDEQLGLEHGTSLAIVYHHIATHQWLIDLSQPIAPGKPLVVQLSKPEKAHES